MKRQIKCAWCENKATKKDGIYNLCLKHYNQLQKDKKVKPTKRFVNFKEVRL